MSSRIVSKDPNIPFAVDQIYVEYTIRIVSHTRWIWFTYRQTEFGIWNILGAENKDAFHKVLKKIGLKKEF